MCCNSHVHKLWSFVFLLGRFYLNLSTWAHKNYLVVAFNSTLRCTDNIVFINNTQCNSSRFDRSKGTQYQRHLMVFHICFMFELYYKQDHFSLYSTNSSLLCPCSNIPLSSACGVYVSQLIQCARGYSAYDQFLKDASYLWIVVSTVLFKVSILHRYMHLKVTSSAVVFPILT